MQLYSFLSEEFSVSQQDISDFALSAPKRYKIYSIPKRTSGKRIIAHPAKKLKTYQRALNQLFEQILPVHKVAFAYKKNSSIKQNAEQHKKSKYLLKMDFQNFFHSITPTLFFSILKQLNIELAQEDYYLLRQLLFWSPSKRSDSKLVLSIGAPSSPLVSNVTLFFFDTALQSVCKDQGITYTRYADDLTFSSNKKGVLFSVPEQVKQLLIECFDGFIIINESKTIFSSMAHNRHVTGVTINNAGELSIGRQRKKYLSSLIHRFSLNQLAEEDFSYLQGFFSFACHIEPMFKQRMIKKYSIEVIQQIVKGRKEAS